MRLLRCGWRYQRRLLRLLDADIDDVVLFFAKRMNVDVADQVDLDTSPVTLALLRYRCDIGRRGQLGIRQIERQRRVEGQRQLLLVECRRHAAAVGQFKKETSE